MDAERVLDGLNQAQKAAVTSAASVLQVLAPPGSGKTKTLTARAAYLIAHHGLNPRNIIVCTFTNKAAKDMGDRICSFLGKEIAGKLILGTFHSIARRFLSAYGKLIGLDEKFGIADTSDTTSILNRIIKRRKINVNPSQARSRISSLKSQNITSEQFSATTKKIDQQEFAILYLDYEEHLKISNLLDFDDLLMRCAELLERHSTCVANIEAILIDEFQDTNNIQYQLMELFAQSKENITIVGDPDQSIYGWRNAEIKNLTKMQQRYPDTHVIHLEENYRSSGAILLTAQEVIEQDESRPPKRLMPTHSVGMRPVLRKLPAAVNEASWLVSEVKRTATLTGGLLRWSDYAILLRTASLSRLFESALGKAGIPYRMVGGHRFYDRMEVKLVLDYLRVISHPDNNDAIVRVINVPSRKVGDITVQHLVEEAEADKVPLWKVVLNAAQGKKRPQTPLSTQAQKGIELFTNLVLTAQKKLQCPQQEDSSLADFVAYIVQKIGLEGYLRKKEPEEFDTRWANVRELVAQAAEFWIELKQDEAISEALYDNSQDSQRAQNMHDVTTHSTDDSLSQFLANVALATDNQEKEEDGQRKEQITLSTIHKAKGLEWPVVFIPAAYEGSIPHSRAEDNDEERRLLYVAMTRAQALLYVSCPTKNSQRERTTLSPFLSQKPMDSYFDKTGAIFGFEVAKELATILRRPCPDVNTVGNALITIEFARDNQWPASGEYGDEERHQWEFGAHIEPLDVTESRKRRRIQTGGLETGRIGDKTTRVTPLAGFVSATTMQNKNGYSISTTTLSNKFISATELKVNQTRETTSVTEQRKVASLSASAALKRKAGKADSIVAGQGTLVSFLSKNNMKSDESRPILQEPMVVRRGYHDLPAPLRDISSTLNSAHTAPIARGRGGMSTPREESYAVAAGTGEEEQRRPMTKPAATFHTTSVTQVGTTLPPRKTLGVRRSMNGWAARMNLK